MRNEDPSSDVDNHAMKAALTSQLWNGGHSPVVGNLIEGL